MGWEECRKHALGCSFDKGTWAQIEAKPDHGCTHHQLRRTSAQHGPPHERIPKLLIRLMLQL
jgi:hypothetical protein